jgi:hypothetical protein
MSWSAYNTCFFNFVGYLSASFYYSLSPCRIFTVVNKLDSNSHKILYLFNGPCSFIGCWNCSFFTRCMTGTIPGLVYNLILCTMSGAYMYVYCHICRAHWSVPTLHLFTITILSNVDNHIHFSLLKLLLTVMMQGWWNHCELQDSVICASLISIVTLFIV